MINLTEENQVLQQQLVTTLREFNLSIQKPLFDILVSHCEVNSHHGVGILLQRIFSDTQNLISLRSKNLYEGIQSFGRQSVCLDLEEDSFLQVAQKVINYLNHSQPNRLLSVPYFPEDYLLTLVIKKLYDCPLCLFIMDDQNIVHPQVSDLLVQQVIDYADLCLGISHPLCHAYEEKFNKQFWFVPPVVENHLISQQIITLSPQEVKTIKGVLIGNIWSQKWLDKLRFLCREASISLDWYGNPNRSWLSFDKDDLEKDGIFLQGFLPEWELIERLRDSHFAVIPTGISEEPEDRPELSKMSLPSRSCFMVATANLPILVIGSGESAVAKFVLGNGLGAVCSYELEDFENKVDYLCYLENQQRIRTNAFHLSQSLGAEGVADWIWHSLEKKAPIDLRFEDMSGGLGVKNATALVTASEVTQKHGTGVLMLRVFKNDSQIISVRSDNHYGGDHHFGVKSYYLPQRGFSRKAVFNNIACLFMEHEVHRLFCVPYYTEDLLTAIAIKELYNLPMAIWIMDDQNICVNNIPDELMREFLEKAGIRFVTHPELREAYEAKYGLKFWLLPAIVTDSLITTKMATPLPENYQQKRGALIGSIWSQQWFQMLCDTISRSGAVVDWYGNSQYFWFTKQDDELQAEGIYPKGLYPEPELTQQLSLYPFVVVPTGTLDDRDDQPQLSQLSLPGRILFVLATSNTPVILLGSPQTSAAHFVNHFQIGVVCDYTPEAFKQAVAFVLDPQQQQRMRENALKVAQNFSDRHIEQWIWQSLSQGIVQDQRFEAIFGYNPSKIT